MSKIIVRTWRYDSFSSIWIRNRDVTVNSWQQANTVAKEAKESGYKFKIVSPFKGVN